MQQDSQHRNSLELERAAIQHIDATQHCEQKCSKAPATLMQTIEEQALHILKTPSAKCCLQRHVWNSFAIAAQLWHRAKEPSLAQEQRQEEEMQLVAQRQAQLGDKEEGKSNKDTDTDQDRDKMENNKMKTENTTAETKTWNFQHGGGNSRDGQITKDG